MAVTTPRPRRRRRLALGVLLAAVALAVAAFPVRATWWGGWILAVAEAGIVGGLADWFAVTALFRHPLGLPIPHTALIPANWQLMAARVGTMVGDRVLTTEYVNREVSRVDVADLLARAAERVRPDDLARGVRAVATWAADEIPRDAAVDLVAWLRGLFMAQPVSPLLADLLDVARRRRWDEQVVETLADALASALDRPEVRAAVAELIDGIVSSYRERMGGYPSLLIGFANMIGLINRDRLVSALLGAVRKVAEDPEDPLRRRLRDVLSNLPGRLRDDPDLIARVESAKRDFLSSPVAAKLLSDGAARLHQILITELRDERSDLTAWVTNQLERLRLTVAGDEALRGDLDRWLKSHATAFVERYQGRIAAFIERGVHALGPEGAVGLIEEHAGDDLQFIRVNGTVVGGLAGGAIHGVHLLFQLL